MKLFNLTAAAAVTLIATSSAFAGPDTTGNPGKGNQGCGYPTADVFKNPGKAFQDIRAANEQNINEFVENNEFVWDPDPETVGEYIKLLCQRPS